MYLDQDISLFEKWALCTCLVGDELWVGSMAGEIVALSLDLGELRRWKAHEGSVNGIQSDGLTYGGDGLVKLDGKVLAGPFKKPVSKVQRQSSKLYVGTYERALYIDGMKHPKVAAFHVFEDGRMALVPQTGTKAGDLGSIELNGEEVAPPAWSISETRAYLKDGRFVTFPGLKPLPWDDPQGPPCVVADRYFIGNHLVRDTQTGGELRLPTKGLYGATLLPDQRIAIAGADGNLKVVNLNA